MKSESVSAGGGPGFIAGLIFGIIFLSMVIGVFSLLYCTWPWASWSYT
jgi:hypothetical protein